MRINKYIASAGICSRRKADELIASGNVKVNGSVLKELGYDVLEEDVVQVNGRTIEASEKLVYYMLNKPSGYVTTTKDEKDRPTVLDLMSDVSLRVFPVGRLDWDSTGLLIMTNDGSLSQHIAHPSKKVYKTYIVEIDGEIKLRELETLRTGVRIENYTTKPAIVDVLKQSNNYTKLQIKISEGKNRQIRKMCKAVGYNVLSLNRIAIGNIQLGHLYEGHYRKLTMEEINYLKNC